MPWRNVSKPEYCLQEKNCMSILNIKPEVETRLIHKHVIAFLHNFCIFPISWMQSAEELDYGGPQKYLLIKIVAQDCCRRLLPNLHPEIRNMHLAQTSNNSTFKSYRKSDLATNYFFVPKITIHNSFTQFTEEYLIYVLI